MIQDIGDHSFDNGYRAIEPDALSYALAYRKGQALVGWRSGDLVLPRVGDWDVPVRDLFCRYLFAVDGNAFFLVENDLLATPEGFGFEPLVVFRRASPRWLAFAGVTGHQLFGWYGLNRFCGRCGCELGHVSNRRELACSACGNVVYPRINPAVIVGVRHEDRLLLTRYARGYRRLALVAGFVEVGESLEETVRREVMEEVGLHVGRLRYYKSQPWSFSDALLSGYFCDVEGDSTIRVDGRELSSGRWLGREELLRKLGEQRDRDSSSLTNEMILAFAQGVEPR